jgi:hypothetical protein
VTVEDRIKALEQQRRAAEDELLVLQPPTGSDWAFAKALHERYCGADHTAECHWEYEKTWAGGAHARWLKRAQAMRKTGVSDEKIVQIIDGFRRG